MYKYNKYAKYKAGSQEEKRKMGREGVRQVIIDIAFDLQKLTKPEIYTSSSTYFKTSYIDIFNTDLQINLSSVSEYLNKFIFGPKEYYQNQLNFCLWLAATGCGISKEMLLNEDYLLQRSILRFHAYYQTRRFLNRLKVPIPNDQFFNNTNNFYDHREYESLCDEFGISKNDSFVINVNYLMPLESVISKLPQDANELKQFIIDKSNGFTETGIRYLNDSIRTYSWLILGSQVQTRTTIIGHGKELDAQHQYLKNLEAAIYRAEDLSKSIADYQDTLEYARSKLDYVIAYGCYMCPSNMNLKIGTVNDYYNMIQEATDDMKLGMNNNVNLNLDKTSSNSTQTSIHTNKETTNTTNTTHEEKKEIIMAISFCVIVILYLIS